MDCSRYWSYCSYVSVRLIPPLPPDGGKHVIIACGLGRTRHGKKQTQQRMFQQFEHILFQQLVLLFATGRPPDGKAEQTPPDGRTKSKKKHRTATGRQGKTKQLFASQALEVERWNTDDAECVHGATCIQHVCHKHTFVVVCFASGGTGPTNTTLPTTFSDAHMDHLCPEVIHTTFIVKFDQKPMSTIGTIQLQVCQ